MTFAEVIENIDLSGYPVPLKLSIKKGGVFPGTAQRMELLVVEMKTTSREDPAMPWVVATEIDVPSYINTALDYSKSAIHHGEKQQTMKMVLEWVFMAVRKVLIHELQEKMLYKRKRFFDPHKDG